jgi:hypothetical protein
MSLVIPVGYAQVAYRWSLLGDPEFMISTIGYGLVTGQPLQVQAQGLADSWLSTMGVAANQSNQYTFKGVVMRVGNATGPPTIVEEPRNVVGGAAGDVVLPQNCSLLVKKFTGAGGRANRGRMYIPPTQLYENLVDSRGVLGAPTLASIQASLDSWHATSEFVILHDSTSPVQTPTVITKLNLDSRIATQRRRLRP